MDKLDFFRREGIIYGRPFIYFNISIEWGQRAAGMFFGINTVMMRQIVRRIISYPKLFDSSYI